MSNFNGMMHNIKYHGLQKTLKLFVNIVVIINYI